MNPPGSSWRKASSDKNSQQIYFCRECLVSCAGLATYCDHLVGQKHKKKVARAGRVVETFNCKVCNINCNNKDSLEAHLNGVKHKKMLKNSSPSTPGEEKVGEEYVEENKDNEGKIVAFYCTLCSCNLTDPLAKGMHIKGRRHRLKYKNQVQPDLSVDVKPTLREKKRQKKLIEKDWAAIVEHDA